MAVMNRMDNRAFEILVRQHHRRLLGFALAFVADKAAAEDIVQEAFVTAYAKLDKFDAAGDFSAWMRSIVRFKYLEWCRTQRETAVAPETLEGLEDWQAEWDESESEKGQVLSFLQTCVQALPEAMTNVVDLFYFKGWHGRRIAEHIGSTEVTVRQRLKRARSLLSDCVAAQFREQKGVG